MQVPTRYILILSKRYGLSIDYMAVRMQEKEATGETMRETSDLASIHS